MKKIILIYLFIGISIFSNSQTIIIIDKTSLQALPYIAIYSNTPKVSVITNNSGKAKIDAFKGADSIFFRHVSYADKVYSYNDLAKLNFKVMLTEKTYSIDEVVVSASKFEEKRKDVAQSIDVIKSKELALISQPTTADVMQNSGNVLVQKSQLGGGSPIIRGFETNKVLMVVDGVRMNNAIYRGGHVQNIVTLDNSIMEKIEVVFGPGAAVYGSDALGGVMHFYTKNPLVSDTTLLQTKVNAYTRYSSACSEKSGHIDFNLGWKKFASLTSFTYSDFSDLRQGANRNPFYGDWGKRTFYAERVNGKDSMFVNNNYNIQKQSGYKQYDVLQKFLLKQNKNISHVVNFQYSTSSDVPRYDRLTTLKGSLPAYAQWYYGPQKRLFASYSLNLTNVNKLYDNARIILGYQNIEESRNDRKFNKSSLNHRIEKLDIVSINADFAKRIKRNEIRYGFEGNYNKVNSSANQEDILTEISVPIDTRYPDGGSTMQSLALYLTHTFEISEKLILNDGIRFSNIKLNSVFNDTTFFPFPFKEVTQNNYAINGNIGIVYMPGADWRFTIVGSRGFRAPNVDDLSKVFDSSPGNVVIPNPNLKPEYTYNLDFGISKAINKSINIGATCYYTIYNNAITTNTGTFNGQDSIMYNGQLSKVTMSVNAAEAYIYGANAYLTAEVTDNFSITNTVNYTYGRIKTDTIDYPLDHIPPMFGKTSFNLKLKKFNGEFFILYNGAKLSRNYNLMGEDNQSYSADVVKGYMPAWVTLNIRTAYQFNKFLQLQFAVENILDQNYRVFASNISASGRNVILTLRGTF